MTETMKRIFLTFVVALFATFAFTQTKTELKPGDLPKRTTDYIAQHMKGFTIDKAYKVENKGVMSYAVIVMKGKEKHKMHFDKDGSYITSAAPAEVKKIEAAPAPKAKEQRPKQETPATKPAGEKQPEGK
jgi:hypothetical protein